MDKRLNLDEDGELIVKKSNIPSWYKGNDKDFVPEDQYLRLRHQAVPKLTSQLRLPINYNIDKYSLTNETEARSCQTVEDSDTPVTIDMLNNDKLSQPIELPSEIRKPEVKFTLNDDISMQFSKIPEVKGPPNLLIKKGKDEPAEKCLETPTPDRRSFNQVVLIKETPKTNLESNPIENTDIPSWYDENDDPFFLFMNND